MTMCYLHKFFYIKKVVTIIAHHSVHIPPNMDTHPQITHFMDI